MIDTAIDNYKSLDSDRPIIISVHVVNPRLAGVLSRKYGFKIDREHGDGSFSMIYDDAS